LKEAFAEETEPFRTAKEAYDYISKLPDMPNKQNQKRYYPNVGAGGASYPPIPHNKPTVAVRNGKKPGRQPRPGRGYKAPQTLGSRTNLAGYGPTMAATLGSRPMPFNEDEYIADVVVANQPNFNVVTYPVNPGQASTFPWLSKIALNFEKYQFDYLEFYVRRVVSEFAAAGAGGKVILSFDADASDAPPSSKQIMEATVPHADGMPSENIRMPIPINMLRRLTDGFFIRPGILPGASDIKTYDIGNLSVATQGIASNVQVGELRVRYRGRFLIPQLESLNVIPINNSVTMFNTGGGGQVAAATGIAFVLQPGVTISNGLGITSSAGVYTLPPGNYLVDGQALFSESVGGDLQVTTLDFYDVTAGASVLGSNVSQYNIQPAVASTITNNFTFFLQTTGVHTYALRGTVNYTGGVITCFSSIRFVAM